MTSTLAPIAASFARLRAFEHLCRAQVGADIDDSWVRLDRVLDDGLDRLFGSATRAGGRPTHYVGASVASALVDALVGAALPALLVDRRLPDVSPANVAGRLAADELWFEQVSLHDARCVALTSDPDADHPSVEPVGSVHELHRRFADVLAHALSGWFAAIRARAPFGQRGMWGQLADGVCGTALWTARATGIDQRSAWEEAQAILDLVAAAVPQLRVRPRLFPVRWSGGESLWQVKGTCCLWYTTNADPDPDGDGYCTTCPLRSDAVRHACLAEWLETTAAPAATAAS